MVRARSGAFGGMFGHGSGTFGHVRAQCGPGTVRW